MDCDYKTARTHTHYVLCTKSNWCLCICQRDQQPDVNVSCDACMSVCVCVCMHGSINQLIGYCPMHSYIYAHTHTRVRAYADCTMRLTSSAVNTMCVEVRDAITQKHIRTNGVRFTHSLPITQILCIVSAMMINATKSTHTSTDWLCKRLYLSLTKRCNNNKIKNIIYLYLYNSKYIVYSIYIYINIESAWYMFEI